MTFKTGQIVIRTQENGRREIRTVGYQSKNDVELVETKDRKGAHRPYDSETGIGSGRWTKGCKIESATPQLIAEVNAENEAKIQTSKAEQARIANDPKTPIISRLAGGFDNWDKLTLEQLQQITSWLDN